MRAKIAVLALLSAFAVVPHASICARSRPLSAVLEMGVITELSHLALHAILFGLLAAALLAWIVRAEAAREERPLRAVSALAYFGGIVLARQAMQLALCGRAPGAEEAFELFLDAVAGALGAVGWAIADPQGASRVAGALGWFFHPAAVAPLGFFALCWSRTGSATVALRWTSLVLLFEVPAIGLWLWGVRRARFSDADVSVRQERLPLLFFAVLSSVALLAGTLALGAPAIVVSCAVGAILGAALATAITRCGLKLSGHVAVAAGPAFALLPDAPRGALVFALMALVLFWARVRAERHTAHEALAGFVLAALVSGLSFQVW
jgi:hypothetical protein